MIHRRHPAPRTRSAIRVVVTGVAVFLLLTVVALPAMAHAQLVGSDPDHDTTLKEAPTEIRLDFNQEVRTIPDGIVIRDSGDLAIEGESRIEGLSVIFVPDSAIPDGTTVLTWRVISEDGHAINGNIVFHVREVTGTGDIIIEEPTMIGSVLANAVMYVGLILGGGLALFWTHIHDGRSGSRSISRLALLLIALALTGTFALMLVTALEVSGQVTRESLPAGGIEAAGLVLVGSAMVFAGILRGRRPLVTAGVPTALISLVFVGHTRSFGPTWLVGGADFAHVMAGAVWAGGLLGLAIVCRERRQHLSDPKSPLAKPVVGIIRKFSRVAGWMLLVVLVSGVTLTWRITGSWAALFGTGHGRLVMVKLGIVAVVATVGAFNRFRLLPRIETSRAVRATVQLGTSTTFEVLGLSLLLAATAVLVQQDPRQDQFQEPISAQGPVQTALDQHGLTVTLDRATTGVNRIDLELREPTGGLLDLPEAPRLALIGDDRTTYETTPEGDGYTATIDIPDTGPWQLEIRARVDTFSDVFTTLVLDTDARRLTPVDGIVVANARMAQPLQAVADTVVYMTIISSSDDLLAYVESPACEQVSFHESVVSETGTVSMQPRDGVELTTLEPSIFTAGALHIMCEGVDPDLTPGVQVPFSITTGSGARTTIMVEVTTLTDLASRP